ncbi:carbohydrate ABC transporter permease (plasmid) [Deinococcus taeanensis]|uniref:carbohydrate ABC transporter permease n=1 Tax=Deinococcus taeanensis TaxID=2737050 RepID=UPI001CDD3E6E|nr:carbohydrate ABC transporter permease [Deinococcus taeanensis]UBV44598.1 carbohydrate ABC transporter permease [Deinococcus taeanensis]
MRRSRLQSLLVYLGALLFAASVLLPVAWMLLSSVMPSTQLTALPLRWWPGTFDWSRYAALLTLEPNTPGQTFLYALRNSAVVALTTTAIALAAGIPAAYALSRFPAGKGGLLATVIATYMLPPVALVLPLYQLLAHLHLLNTVWGLILVYCSLILPFTTWLLKSNFDAVPVEIEESGLIDGLSRTGTMTRLVVPLALPGVTTSAIFAVLLAWDEFFYGLLFTNGLSAKTLPVAIADFTAGRATDYGLIMAAGALAALPPVLIAVALQRGLLAGLTSGGVKG